MNAADIRAELEADRLWRDEELMFLKRHLTELTDDASRERYRRVLVVMLYAHFEGYCRSAFATYASAVARSGARARDVTWPVAAASLDDVFRAFRDMNKKNHYFRKDLPEDAKLHRFSREIELLEGLDGFLERPASMPEDVVDTESNLSCIVVRKILFRLGLSPAIADPWESAIGKLLGRRNSIAHGSEKKGVKEKELEGLEAAAKSVMDAITQEITKTVAASAYLRPSPPKPGVRLHPLL